jgi:hypothetical protein
MYSLNVLIATVECRGKLDPTFGTSLGIEINLAVERANLATIRRGI